MYTENENKYFINHFMLVVNLGGWGEVGRERGIVMNIVSKA